MAQGFGGELWERAALLDSHHRDSRNLRASAQRASTGLPRPAPAGAPATPVASIARLVGERTRDLRRKHGMTRRALSQQADVSERYLALLENGSGNVSLLLLERIAHALDTRLSDLVAEAGTSEV